MKAESDEEDNYFSPKTQHFIVQKFVFPLTTHKIEARTDKAVSIHKRERLNRDMNKLVGKTGETMDERAWRESRVIELQMEYKRTTPEEVEFEYFPDERFSDIKDLIKKYRNEVDVSPDEWKQVERKLYGLVMIMIDEKRIRGEFELPPLQDFLEFQKLRAEMKRLEERVDNLDATSVDMPKGSGKLG